jgi:hypothetical protein
LDQLPRTAGESRASTALRQRAAQGVRRRQAAGQDVDVQRAKLNCTGVAVDRTAARNGLAAVGGDVRDCCGAKRQPYLICLGETDRTRQLGRSISALGGLGQVRQALGGKLDGTGLGRQIAARTGGRPLPRRRAGYSDVASQRGAICRINLGLKNAAKARVDA